VSVFENIGYRFGISVYDSPLAQIDLLGFYCSNTLLTGYVRTAPNEI